MNTTEIRPSNLARHALHPEYGNLSAEEVRERGRTKLQEYVERGKSRAQAVVSAIVNDTPKDAYVPTGKFSIGAEGEEFRALIDGKPARIHQHGLDQAAERLGLNLKYLHSLQGKGAWGRTLAADNFNALLQHTPARYLVREVRGEVRAVLSDAYKRIDSRPTVDALIGAAAREGALVVDGIYSPTRVALKVVMPDPVEVFPGEWMVYGLDYSNSDFGDGAQEWTAFVLRLVCLNGAQVSTSLRKIHIGKRFSGDDLASARTMELDAKAQASYARDVVGKLLSREALDSLVEQVRGANARHVEAAKIEGFLEKHLNKGEAELVRDKFASAEVEELPPGQSAWRFSNALSFLARETEDGRRKMQVERLAGDAMVLA